MCKSCSNLFLNIAKNVRLRLALAVFIVKIISSFVGLFWEKLKMGVKLGLWEPKKLARFVFILVRLNYYLFALQLINKAGSIGPNECSNYQTEWQAVGPSSDPLKKKPKNLKQNFQIRPPP